MTPDQNIDQQLLEELVGVAARNRRLYPRGGFAGLRPHALQVLAALSLLGELSSPELAGRLNLHRSSVRHALGTLRKRGLVTEEVDQTDRRRRTQRLTSKGRRQLSRYVRWLNLVR